ncbi:hypothetical protein LEMLEM_LOCUS1752, partial [Lemmus lemmus]
MHLTLIGGFHHHEPQICLPSAGSGLHSFPCHIPVTTELHSAWQPMFNQGQTGTRSWECNRRLLGARQA